MNSPQVYLVLVNRYEAADSLDAFVENVKVSSPGQSGKLKITYEGEDAVELRGRSGKAKFMLARDVAYVETNSDSLYRPAPVFQGMLRRFYEENGETHLLTGVALSWLREQPAGTVVLDPTVVLTSALNDGYIYSAQPNTSYGSDVYLYVGNQLGVQRTLIQFNLVAIPKNAIIISSELKLYFLGTTYTPLSRTIQCHEVLQSWGEAYASWHYRGPGPTWNVDGVGLNDIDAKSTPEGSQTWYSDYNAWKTYNILALTQRWVSGTSINNSVLLWATNETTGTLEAKRICSAEYTTDVTKRPQMVISYRLDPMVEYQYDAEGRPTTVTYANGVTETNVYNQQRGWIMRRDYQKAGANVFYFENSVYDNVGNVKRQNYKQSTEVVRQMDYDYDALYRIKTFKYGGVTKQTYTYDDNGNFKTFGSRTFTYTTGSNRLVNDGARSYTSDNSGRVKQIASTPMTYDIFNNMKAYGSDSYSYDADNTRVKKIEAGVTTYYITDGLNVLAEYDGTGKLVAEYVHDDYGLVAKYDSTRGHFWFYKDHLGSTRRLEPATTRWDYWPFGEAYTTSGTETDYLFTGKELDNTSGLYYFGARYYDPRIGRWLVVDPLAEKYPWLSPYTYSANNPITYYDPDGLDWYRSDSTGVIQWFNGSDARTGYTHLGEDLTFTFNSFIDKLLWDGPNPQLWEVYGDKLTSIVHLDFQVDAEGNPVGLNISFNIQIGATDGISFFRGQSSFGDLPNYQIASIVDPLNFAINFEQHTRVPTIEALGLALLGYDIVNVAQQLNISSTAGKLSLNAATDIFPSATLALNRTNLFYYQQPSFKATHGYDRHGSDRHIFLVPRRPAPAFYQRYP